MKQLWLKREVRIIYYIIFFIAFFFAMLSVYNHQSGLLLLMLLIIDAGVDYYLRELNIKYVVLHLISFAGLIYALAISTNQAVSIIVLLISAVLNFLMYKKDVR